MTAEQGPVVLFDYSDATARPGLALAFDQATANVRVSADAAQVVSSDVVLEQRAAAFTLGDYLVEQGRPQDLPPLAVLATTVSGLGAFETAQELADPGGVDTGADARWLAAADTFTEAVSWRSEGGALQWTTTPGTTPYLDPDYSYERGDVDTYRPAVVFAGGDWMALSSKGWAAAAATVAVVAVLHHGAGESYGIVESRADEGSTAAAAATDFGLRYTGNTVEVYAGGRVASHAQLGRTTKPVVLVLSLGPTEGVLGVVDTRASVQTFTTDGLRLYDVALYLGRLGASADAASTAVMEVLEVDYFARALDLDEVNSLAATLDACYGAST